MTAPPPDRHAAPDGRVAYADRAALAPILRDVLLEPAEAAQLRVHGRTSSAVLVPLYVDRDGRLTAVLTKRRDDMRRHAGEISFPGGRQDPGDPDLQYTALREAQEEIGLAPDGVEVVGALQPTPTIATDFAVYPFVGLIEPGLEWVPSAGEVAQILELPLAALRDGHGRQRLMRRGVPFRTDVYVVGEHLVWGATARMLADLLQRLPPELLDAH